MQIQMQQRMNRDKYFIYKENIHAAIKRQGDADILMMTSIPFHCLFMLYLPSVTRLFSSTLETIRNLVFNTKLPVGITKYFYLFNLPWVVLVPLGRQKIHCSMDSSFPFSQLFSSSSQSACLSDLKAWSLHMGLWVVMVKNCFEFHNNNKKINGFSKLDL